MGFRPDMSIVKLSGLTCHKEGRHKEKEIICLRETGRTGEGVNSTGRKGVEQKAKGKQDLKGREPLLAFCEAFATKPV